MDFAQSLLPFLHDGFSRSDLYNYILFMISIIVSVYATVMIFKFIYRNLHVTKPCWAVEKSQLAKLRKNTGYTFTHCKNALEMHNNDIGKVNDSYCWTIFWVKLLYDRDDRWLLVKHETMDSNKTRFVSQFVISKRVLMQRNVNYETKIKSFVSYIIIF